MYQSTPSVPILIFKIYFININKNRQIHINLNLFKRSVFMCILPSSFKTDLVQNGPNHVVKF
ncbi:ORF1062 [White spot syndrome virus]|uniref:ORF1062 n=1 Tax=White spot syndrome virus TaxID=342409 RepID=A0A2D3I739_9VIRU|nr:ORF1062 [White spot syndrome virus]